MKVFILAACLSLMGAVCAARAQAGKGLEERLIACVRGGDADCVARALSEGADPNASDERGVPALVTAAEGRSTRAVRLLLDAGADADGGRRREGAPLCRAALFGRVEHVEALLEKGAKVNVVCGSDHGDSPLMDALRGAMLGSLPGDLKEALAGDPNEDGAGAADDDEDRVARPREAPEAPPADFLAAARALLAGGADPDVVARCDGRETALVYAAMGAHVGMVKELLAYGADVNKGTSALAMLRLFDREEAKALRPGPPALSKEQAAVLAWSRETAAAREEIKRLLRDAGAKEDGEGDEAAGPEENN